MVERIIDPTTAISRPSGARYRGNEYYKPELRSDDPVPEHARTGDQQNGDGQNQATGLTISAKRSPSAGQIFKF